MASSEKYRLQAQARQNEGVATATATPADLPPSYEHIITSSNNSRSTSTLQTASQAPQPQIPSQNPFSTLTRVASIPFTKYRLRDAKLSDDQSTMTTSNAEVSTTQHALTRFIHEQACLPPKPIMVIRGTHLGSGGHYQEPVVDFELRFNLMGMLDLDVDDDENGNENGGGSGRRQDQQHQQNRRIRITQPFQSSGTPGPSGSGSGSSKHLSREYVNLTPLEQWVKKFCDDKAENRSFTIHRKTRNFPTEILEGMVRTLVATAKYRGRVTVEFPLQQREVVVSSRKSGGNWFTNILVRSLYAVKKYEVVEVVWDVGGAGAGEGTTQQQQQQGGSTNSHSNPVANATVPSSSSSPSSQDADPSSSSSTSAARAAQVAQEWWREWHFATWNAMLSGRRGWVTVEDWIEARMGLREKERPRDWGVDYEAS